MSFINVRRRFFASDTVFITSPTIVSGDNAVKNYFYLTLANVSSFFIYVGNAFSLHR